MQQQSWASLASSPLLSGHFRSDSLELLWCTRSLSSLLIRCKVASRTYQENLAIRYSIQILRQGWIRQEARIDRKSPALTIAKPQLPIAIPRLNHTGKIPPIVRSRLFATAISQNTWNVLTIGAKSDLGIQNNVQSRTQSVHPIASTPPRNYLLQ